MKPKLFTGKIFSKLGGGCLFTRGGSLTPKNTMDTLHPYTYYRYFMDGALVFFTKNDFSALLEVMFSATAYVSGVQILNFTGINFLQILR